MSEIGRVEPLPDMPTTRVAEWDEVHVTGDPVGDYPRYDVTVTSDNPERWAAMRALIDDDRSAFRRNVANVHVRYRSVRQVTTTTSWRTDVQRRCASCDAVVLEDGELWGVCGDCWAQTSAELHGDRDG